MFKKIIKGGCSMILKLTKRFLLTFLILLIFPLHDIYANGYSWQLVQSSQNIIDIYYDSSSGAVYALAYDLGVLKSTNDGATWVAKNNGIDIFPGDAWRLQKISGDGNGHIFLATQGSYFYRSLDGGNTWQQVATGLTAEGSSPISMTFDSYTNKLFITKNGNGVFRSADLGETWEQINIDSNNNVYSIYSGKADATGATGMLLAGTYYSGINKSTDGGSNWVSKGSIYWVEDIISGPNDWLFGIIGGWRLERSKDYGESWETVVSSPNGRDLAYDPISGYVYYATSSNYIRYSSDGGDSWGDIQISSDTDIYTREVECLPTQTIIVGTASGIYRLGPPVDDTNEPPSTPALTSPSTGYRVYGSSVKLYWQKSTDPEGGDVTYRLQVAEDANFTVNLREYIVDENGVLLPAMMLPFLFLIGWGGRNKRKQTSVLMIAAILLITSLFAGCGSGGWGSSDRIGDENTISYEVAGLEAGKTCYWRVIAVDENDEPSDPSETRNFIVN